jgi:hypothetical protein
MRGSTFAYKVARRVHVAVHGERSPGDEEWGAYLADIGARLGGVDAIYSLTYGGGPDGDQRKHAVEFWRRQPRRPPIAVVTPSLLVVRMAGALRWFMPSQIKAFIPRDVASAYEYLGLDAEQRQAVANAVAELGREQGLPAVGR